MDASIGCPSGPEQDPEAEMRAQRLATYLMVGCEVIQTLIALDILLFGG